MKRSEAVSGRKTAVASSRRQAARRKRQALTLISLCAIGTIGLLGTGILAWMPPTASKESTQPTDLAEHGMGSVVFQTTSEQCRLMTFDNYSGRVVDKESHCESTVPVDTKNIRPIGTIRRLDAISRSFLDRNH